MPKKKAGANGSDKGDGEMDNELKIALKKIGAKRTFMSFSEAILENYDVLKPHYIFQFHDDYSGDFYDFDFYENLKGSIKIKFDLLGHILSLDEGDRVEELLKELSWQNMPPDCGLDTEGMINEATSGKHALSHQEHNLQDFCNFEKREWENFVNYFLEPY